MARNRASMREGPLAELFRATEAAQRQDGQRDDPAPEQTAPAAAPPRQTPAEQQRLPEYRARELRCLPEIRLRAQPLAVRAGASAPAGM